MNTGLLIAVVWFILSLILAPVIGRLIHDRRVCPVCIARTEARRRHPSRLTVVPPEDRPDWGQR